MFYILCARGVQLAAFCMIRHNYRMARQYKEVHSFVNETYTTFGPSVAVQAVSRSDDGTTIIIDFFSFLFFSLFSSTAVVKIPEGVVVGFQIFAWAPKKK